MRIFYFLKRIILLAFVFIIAYYLLNYFWSAESENTTRWKQLLTGSGIAGGIIFLSLFPLLGLPGAVVLLLSPLLGYSSENISGDRAWPAAIITSILWPIGIPIGILARSYAIQQPLNIHPNLAFLSVLFFGIVLVLIVVNVMSKKSTF